MVDRRLGPSAGVAALAALVLAASLAAGNHLGPRDQNAVHLVVLTHDADLPPVLGSPPSPNGTVPAVRVDGVHVFRGPPVGEGGAPQQEAYDAYRETYEERARRGSPFALNLTVQRESDGIRATIFVQSLADPYFSFPVLQVLLFEDSVEVPGATALPSVVRAEQEPEAISSDEGASFEFSIDPTWRSDRLGVAAYVGTWKNETRDVLEVHQAVVWYPHQAGSSVQISKAVLLELYTQAGCAPCRVAERAVSQLADEFGDRSDKDDARSYLPDTALWKWLAAAGAGVLVAAALRGKRPSKKAEVKHGLPP